MPSWFARNSLMKMATRASRHISCHEKPKLNDNILFDFYIYKYVKKNI